MARWRAFAIANGLVDAARVPRDGIATVRIWQANIGKTIVAHVPMTAGEVQETGDYELDGVTFPAAEVVAAREAVTRECAAVETWFDDFAVSLASRHPVEVAVPSDDARTAPELTAAWTAVRLSGRRDGVFAVLRLLWVEQRLDDLNRLRADLAGTATEFNHQARPCPTAARRQSGRRMATRGPWSSMPTARS